MATIKETLDKVARRTSIVPPPSWITASALHHQAIKDALDETVEELLDRVDWPAPITKNVTITGTGAETYPFPADFLRFSRDDGTVYETTTTRRRGIPVPTNSDWTFLKDWGSASGDRYFRLSGDEDSGFEISFFQPIATGDEVIVSYISKNWMRSSGGTEGSEWTDAGDVLILPSDLVRLGCIWRRRRDRGLPYQAQYNEYEIHVTRRSNDRRVVRTINFGEQEARNPFDIQPPDFIPPA